MVAQDILEKITAGAKTHTLRKLQTENLTNLIPGYAALLNEFKLMSKEAIEEIFKEVKQTRPLVGKRLKEQVEKDLQS